MIQYHANGVTVFQSALYETTSTVVETPSFVLIVDPTWLPHEVDEIRTFIAKMRRERPLYLLFTHSDWDHIIGYKAFPDAITIGSNELANNSDKQEVVEQILSFDSRNYLRRNYEIVYPLIDIVIHEDGQQLVIGNTTITFFNSPGHTKCGIFSIIEPQGIFIAGDYLSNIEFPYIYHNSESYENTLHKVDQILENHQVNLLVPGHGKYTTEKTEILLRKHRSFDYIQTLRNHLLNDNQKEIDKMLYQYEFPLGMRLYHETNQTLIKKELVAIGEICQMTRT